MIKEKESGQSLVIVFIALGVVLFTVLSVVAGAQIYFQNSHYSLDGESAVALGEAGIDKALASLNKTAGAYSGETETFLGNGSYSVAITNLGMNKQLEATGYIPNKVKAKVKRVIKVQATNGTGIAFNYGLQVGQGGISMSNGAILNGSVYSNGNISGGNTTTITGDVYVSGGSVADQESDCIGVNCQDYIFGKTTSGEDRQDVAQSFKPSQTSILNKVFLKLKKTGNPANSTVRIMGDSEGKPNKNNVLATGTLSASLVTDQYGFIEVTFTSSPTLNSDTTYWIMIHASALHSANYWYISNDIAQGYNGGVAKWSPNWQAASPAWTTVTPGDFGFKVFIGGVATSLNVGNSSQVNGTVHANTITGGNGVTITGDAYYQVLDPTVTVTGTKFPGSSDPPPTTFPISEANITSWKNEAELAGTTNGSLSYGNSCVSTLGPGKITGSVSFGNGCTVTVKSPVWLEGTLTAGNTTIFKLDSSFGASSGIILVDGVTTLGNGDDLVGSGSSGSYLMLLSTNAQTAISMGNSSISGIVYAPNGIVNLSNGASFKEIVAKGISMGNSAILNYETGLQSLVFSSGPSGSYSLIKGTYQVK